MDGAIKIILGDVTKTQKDKYSLLIYGCSC